MVISAVIITLTEANCARVRRKVFSVTRDSDRELRSSDECNVIWIHVCIIVGPLCGSIDNVIIFIAPLQVRSFRTVVFHSAVQLDVIATDYVLVNHFALRLRHCKYTSNIANEQQLQLVDKVLVIINADFIGLFVCLSAA